MHECQESPVRGMGKVLRASCARDRRLAPFGPGRKGVLGWYGWVTVSGAEGALVRGERFLRGERPFTVRKKGIKATVPHTRDMRLGMTTN